MRTRIRCPADPGLAAAASRIAERVSQSNDPAAAYGNDGADAFGIPEFCRRHHISQSFYFKLQALGLGPAIMKVGSRVLISKEAAAAWRRKRERAAAAEAASIRSEA
jgi:hypothetical protein